MKIYLNKPKEDWVVDRFVKEWSKENNKITTKFARNADIVWNIAPWTWMNIPKVHLKEKKAVCTIHHIDENKFDEVQQKEFFERDQFIDAYHTISHNSKIQIVKLTKKPIYVLPFWVNQKVWFEIKDKEVLRRKYNIEPDVYLVGSFQRDTEGHDLVSPKLSKGPDNFIKIVKDLYLKHEKLTVLLAGKRRNYVINKLKEAKIPYIYNEMVNFKTLNELYNCLDLYIVSSRIEGGPQAILECGITRTPIISTDVGIASEILNKKSIFDMKNYSYCEPDVDYAYNQSKKFILPNGMNSYIEMFRKIHEN